MDWDRERDMLSRFPPDYLPPVTVLLAESRDPFHQHQSMSHSHRFAVPFSAPSYPEYDTDDISMNNSSNGHHQQHGYFSQPAPTSSTPTPAGPAPGSRGGNSISLNVHLTVPGQQPPQPGTVTTTADGSHTPNTPEILNSIVNMQHGPFAGYSQQQGGAAAAAAAAANAAEMAASSYTTLASMPAQQSHNQIVEVRMRLFIQ